GSALPDSAYDAYTVAAPFVSTDGERVATTHPLVTTVVDTADGDRKTLATENLSLTVPLPLALNLRTATFSPLATRYVVVRGQTNTVLDVTADPVGYWELRGALAADA